MNIIRAALIAATLSLAGCSGAVDVPTKVQEGIVKTCNFLADIAWLRNMVASMDITAATVNQLVTKVCAGLAPPVGEMEYLSRQLTKCPKGKIVVDGKEVCIEGTYIEPEDE